jgi:flagella basal body P-ring formation protein FlgA
MLKLLLLLALFANLYAAKELKTNYYVKASTVLLSDIVEGVTQDKILYTITEGRYSKRVKSKELVELLHKLGYTDYVAKHTYVKFEKKSPIKLDKIEQYIRQYYKNSYKNIVIKKITVRPRGYIKKLDNNYTIKMPKKSALHKKGTLSVKTAQNRQLFFDYFIDATLEVYITKNDIKRKEELSFRNTLKKSIILDKFKALPIQIITQGTLQSKFQIAKGSILTTRDVEIISLVKRGATVSVMLNNANMLISFSAKALQSGKNGDTITVQKANGVKLKAVVIGRNRVEIR